MLILDIKFLLIWQWVHRELHHNTLQWVHHINTGHRTEVQQLVDPHLITAIIMHLLTLTICIHRNMVVLILRDRMDTPIIDRMEQMAIEIQKILVRVRVLQEQTYLCITCHMI